MSPDEKRITDAIERRASEVTDPTVIAMAQALLDTIGVDGTPILSGDPDYNELPDHRHMLPDDEICREDIEALARTALDFCCTCNKKDVAPPPDETA